MATSHDHHEDPRNAEVLVYLDGELVPRDRALVSVLDSGFLMGDGVWEGLRVHHGAIPFLDRHLDRLFEAARALELDLAMTREEIAAALHRTLAANRMTDGVHIRLMFTRGPKRTPFQGTSVNLGRPTRVILAEYKDPDPRLRVEGITVGTVHVRRGPPDVQDPALNSHSKLNCVTASLAAARQGVHEALMLDPHGFVATCNSTHFFLVRRGELWTSSGRYCLRGITRGVVLELGESLGLRVREKDFSLTEVYGAEEAFVTGTFAGILPVRELDGRGYAPVPGPVTARLWAAYQTRVLAEVGRA